MIYWIVFIVVVLLMCIVEWMRELRTFKITHYYVTSEKLNGLKKERKIVFLSDLHSYNYGENNDKLIRAIKAEKPDYILVSGDMIVGKPGETTEIAENVMKQLSQICDVFHANGNHEQRIKEDVEIYGDLYLNYESALKDAGVKCLSNEDAVMEWDGIAIRVLGLELPLCKYKKFVRHVVKCEDIDNFLGTSEDDKYQIMIAHNPTHMDTYLKWGADLVVSGHLHGGVVRLPFIGGVISPQFNIFPKYSGEMKVVDGATAIVSKGIGIHTIKIRFMNPAEVVVLSFQADVACEKMGNPV